MNPKGHQLDAWIGGGFFHEYGEHIFGKLQTHISYNASSIVII